MRMSDGSSLEGIQYAKNVKEFYYSPSSDGGTVVDFRPISEMENLEIFFCYNFSPDGSSRMLDILPFGELKELSIFILGTEPQYMTSLHYPI